MVLRFTMLLQSRGVSLTTVDILYNYRKTVCSKTLTRHHENVVKKKRIAIKELVSSKNSGIWFDNYSKYIRHSKLLQSSYDCYSWTTVAAIKYPDTADLNLIPARATLPRSPFNYAVVESFLAIAYESLENVSADSANSMTTLHAEDFTTDHFIPMQVIAENPGSNVGLKNLIDLFSNWTEHKGKYSPFLVDINIYYRSVKRILTGEASRWDTEVFVPVLGFWHMYKIGVERLFSGYLEQLFAPAYSYLWPDKTMVRKPPLSQMESLIAFLLSAFSQLDFDHLGMLDEVRLDSTHRNQTFAVNFYDFFEKFAPILVTYKKQLRSDDWGCRLRNISMLLLLLIQFPCNQYLYGIMYSLVTFDYWHHNYPSIYDLISKNSPLFNEDLGEVLNGMLARTSSINYSVKSDVDKMSTNFLMLAGLGRKQSGPLYGTVKSRKIGGDGNVYDSHSMTTRLVQHLKEVQL